jgi:hypothetical protein
MNLVSTLVGTTVAGLVSAAPSSGSMARTADDGLVP